MALITCPQCGQSVSDSAMTCIHCGCKLKKEPENFYALPPSKQLTLQREYSATGGILPQDFNTQHRTYSKKLKLYIVFLIWFIFPLVGSFVAAFFADMLLLTISAIPLCIIGVLVLLLSKTVKKHNTTMMNMIQNRVHFEKWLNDTQNLNITWEWGSSSQYYLEYKKLKQKEGMK